MTQSNALRLQPWMLALNLAIISGIISLLTIILPIKTKVENDDRDWDSLNQTIGALRNDVTTALGVIGQHGEEFNQMRRVHDTHEVRMTSIDTKLELRTKDRFTFAQWESEKESMLRIYDSQKEKINSQGARIESLENKLNLNE